MTAFGPAGLAIFIFIGATLALTGLYGLEQFARSRLGVGR